MKPTNNSTPHELMPNPVAHPFRGEAFHNAGTPMFRVTLPSAPRSINPHFAARVSTHFIRVAQTRHPERSGPAFFFAPLFGAPGRVAEGSLFDLNMPLYFPTKARS